MGKGSKWRTTDFKKFFHNFDQIKKNKKTQHKEAILKLASKLQLKMTWWLCSYPAKCMKAYLQNNHSTFGTFTKNMCPTSFHSYAHPLLCWLVMTWPTFSIMVSIKHHLPLLMVLDPMWKSWCPIAEK